MNNSYKITVGGRLVTFTHLENGELPDFGQVTSVAAIPFTSDGRLVVVELFKRGLDLPGGHVEPSETSPLETMNREVMEEASMTISDPVLAAVIASDYFDDRTTYMLAYGVRVNELLDFVPNCESKRRVIISKEEFLERYESGSKISMQKMVDEAWKLLKNNYC